METERQRREYELFKCSQDYIDEIERVKPVTTVLPPAKSKKLMEILGDGLIEISECRVKESSPYRKKQSWFARLRDKLREKKEAQLLEAERQARETAEAKEQAEHMKLEKEIADLRTKEQQLKLEYVQKVDNIVATLKSNGVYYSLLVAPPEASQQPPEEDVETEVVEDDEDIEADDASEQNTDEDGCMKF